MSTREATVTDATNLENASTTVLTTPTITTLKETLAETEKAVMGASASVATYNSRSETEAVNTPTSKESAKLDSKHIGNEPKRITRNSPLLSSPTTARNDQRDGSVGAESEPNNSENDDGGKKSQVRGRKSIKEVNETKEEVSKVSTTEKDKDETALTEKELNGNRPVKEQKNPASSPLSCSTISSSLTSTLSTTSVSSSHSTTSSRLTRKSVAQEIAANQRITRNRQGSTGTPPMAVTSKRRPTSTKKKISLPIAEKAPKRKRSNEDSNGSAEPASKHIKVEPKDDLEGNAEKEMSIKIKQEPIESDESAADASSISTIAARGRGRPQYRRKSQIPQSASPSTRATRQSKVVSPSRSISTYKTTAIVLSGIDSLSVTESNKPKRRRVGRPSNQQRRSSLKSSPTGSIIERPDENSKDSMTSSIDDLLRDIKMEKITLDMEEEHDEEMVERVSSIPLQDEKALVVNEKIKFESANDVVEVEPLVVDTDGTATQSNVSKSIIEVIKVHTNESAHSANEPSITTSTVTGEKAASLSPDLVSEGVCEISVKRFYKKAEFLENNLGIEKDPMMGEIVQKVATKKEQLKLEDEVENSTVEKNVPLNVKKTDRVVQLHDDINEGILRLDVTDGADDQRQAINNKTSNLSLISQIGVNASEVELIQAEVTENKAIEPITNEDGEENEIEDDITIGESETISMDNNPSLHEDAPEDDEEKEDLLLILELPAGKGLEHELAELKVRQEENNEKTIVACDNEEAKLTNKEDFHDREGSTGNEKEQVKSKKNDKTENGNEMKDHEGDQVVMADTSVEQMDVVIKDFVLDVVEIDLDSQKKQGTQIKGSENESKPQEQGHQELECDEVLVGRETKSLMEEAVKLEEVVSEKKIKITIPTILDVNKQYDGKGNMRLENTELKDQETVAERELDEVPISLAADIISISSAPTSPCKSSVNSKNDDDSVSVRSNQSSDTKSEGIVDNEPDEEIIRKKEQHFRNLGLVTHKAAEKRRQECIQSSAAAVEASRASQQPSKRNGKISGASAAAAVTSSQEYTGTLKTVIKLNRNGSNLLTSAGCANSNGRKTQMARDNGSAGASTSAGGQQPSNMRRQSLKITFQKGRGRSQVHTDRTSDQQAQGEEHYYTIQNENEGAAKANTSEHHITHGRKLINRSNTSNSTTTTTTTIVGIESSHLEGIDNTQANASSKKDEKEEILIPEKASSFKFHPGRLCEDQCYYCSGKFGLYDTPCHVGQLKSVERQQKILAMEEKLTVDNCLCDACFRHVDRRANVPSYKKRLSASGRFENVSSSPSSGSFAANINTGGDSGDQEASTSTRRKCIVPDCLQMAAHSIRRKCIRKTVKKYLLNFEMPPGTHVWLCQAHHDTVLQCSGCVLCKRRLGKNHMYHITSDTDQLEKALADMGIPVQLGLGTAVCKLCRYFANLLMKPPDSTKSQKAEFVKNYRKRLLQFHNIHEAKNDGSEVDDEENSDVPGTSKAAAKRQKRGKQELNRKSTTPTRSKEMSSPSSRSTGSSSVECIGEGRVDEKQQKQQIIDGDLLSNFDVPINSTDSSVSGSPPPIAKGNMSKLKAILQSSNDGVKSSSEISNALRANPNISMRELFPGEEDLGLHFKAPPFGISTNLPTPEGWTRVQTVLQYDQPTRRLWEELQKPYGNQSSFLRHLILLEKYYRNGDLILSTHASSNATVYTNTVRRRLNSFDHGHCGGLKSANLDDKQNSVDIPTVEICEENDEDDELQTIDVDNHKRSSKAASVSKQLRSRSMSVDKLTKQLSTNAVTITARSKEASGKPGDRSPQKSLLKEKELVLNTSAGNGADLAAANAATAAAHNATSCSPSTSNSSRSILKSNLLGINKSVELLPLNSGTSANRSASNNINTSASLTSNAAIENKNQKRILEVANKLLGNQMESAKLSGGGGNSSGSSLLTSPPELVSLQRRSSGVNSSVAASGSSNNLLNANNNKRPQQQPQQQQQMNISKTTSSTNSHRNAAVPPNVVILPETLTPQERQQSKSWRPTLLPVEDNQHLIKNNGPLYQTADGRRLPGLVQVQSGGKPFLISIFDYNRMCILRREKLMRDQMLKNSKSRQELKQQQHQQQQQQNQQVHKNTAATAAGNSQHCNKNHIPTAAQAAQQQLMQLQLLQMQKQQQLQQQAVLKAAAARYQPIAPKPTATITTTSTNNVGAGANFAAPVMPLLANAITNAAAVNNSGLNNAATNWLWNNFSDASQLLINGSGAPPPPTAQPMAKLPQLLPKPASSATSTSTASSTMISKQHHKQQHHPQHHQQQQQLMLDNSLMSKIPKSLTVIPQHKLMGATATTNNGASGSSGYKE